MLLKKWLKSYNIENSKKYSQHLTKDALESAKRHYKFYKNSLDILIKDPSVHHLTEDFINQKKFDLIVLIHNLNDFVKTKNKQSKDFVSFKILKKEEKSKKYNKEFYSYLFLILQKKRRRKYQRKAITKLVE